MRKICVVLALIVLAVALLGVLLQPVLKRNLTSLSISAFVLKVRFVDGKTAETLGHSLEAEAFSELIRLAFPKHEGPLSVESIKRLRGSFEQMIETQILEFPADMRFEDISVPSPSGPIPVVVVTPPVVEPYRTIVYLHGGGYALLSPRNYLAFLAVLARRAKAVIYAVDYRLAPEFLLPAAIEDGTNVYKYLVYTLGIPSKQIVFAGDSAGGGNVLLNLLSIRDQGVAIPAGAISISPVTDFTSDRDSYTRNAKTDVLLGGRIDIFDMGKFVTGLKTKEELQNPKFSPYFGDWKTGIFPPVLIFAGEWEVLVDDASDMAKVLQEAGVPVTLIVGKHMQHVYVVGPHMFPEASIAVDQAVEFIQKVTSSSYFICFPPVFQCPPE